MADVTPFSAEAYYSQIPKEDIRHAQHFRLPPNKAFLPVAQGASDSPKKHSPYTVKNYGLTELKVDLIYGSKDKIQGTVQTATIQPDEEIVLNPGDKTYEHTALKVYNNADEVANFTVEGGDIVFGADDLAEDLPPHV